jgi:YYY domain-containing protein
MVEAVPSKPKRNLSWLSDVLLVLVLLMGAYFRLSGSDWGQLNIQHPDENFMTSVALAIHPGHVLSDYFNTGLSTLNPSVVGYPAYVYGTLPLFLVHFLAESFGKLNTLTLFGRQLSALADLGTIALLYFIVKRFYKGWVALLAAAFSAAAVMQIQQSHFFTTDSFYTFFLFLTLSVAAVIASGEWKASDLPSETESQAGSFRSRLRKSMLRLGNDPLTYLSAAFGIALGMAAASKLNAVAVAVVLPLALVVRYFKSPQTPSLLSSGQEHGRSLVRNVEDFLPRAIVFLVIGAAVSLVAFRIFQPYAFSGPGFFGLTPNPEWVQKVREQLLQASPNADLPWALQWARRTHLYSFQNLSMWGLGLPLGILAWAGFLWMGWRILKGEWRRHILLWSWTAFYFIWQSMQYNPTMRYQLPIYPLLAMMAAWGIFDWAKPRLPGLKRFNWRVMLSVTIGSGVLVATAGYAYAFSRIYVRPETRIAASNWIYQNVPGPINLQVQTSNGAIANQPLPIPIGTSIQAGNPYQLAFTSQAEGSLNQIVLPHVTNHAMRVTIMENSTGSQVGAGLLLVTSTGSSDPSSQLLLFSLQPTLYAQQSYSMRLEVLDPTLQLDLCSPLQLSILAAPLPLLQAVDPSSQCMVSAAQPYQTIFTSIADGVLSRITFDQVLDLSSSREQSLRAILSTTPNPLPQEELANLAVTANFSPTQDPRGLPLTLKLNPPVNLQRGITYYLQIQTSDSSIIPTGATIANETDYDYPLPFRTASYDAFGGIYRGDLNLQVYWDDNAAKLARFENVLDQTDYIFIPTNHQYAQITRIPERYPLTSEYYRQLIGCPLERDIIWCYRQAEPGLFEGKLGFKLVATFESYPSIASLVLNDQAAEEAFTFYDHPKVLIFEKTSDYNPATVRSVLGGVDYSKAVHLTPGQADSYKSLMLPLDQLAIQQEGGTWSELFNRDGWVNRYPGLGLVLWYLVIFALGLFVYPLVRAGLPGLADHGYPLARIVGLLLWAWLAWMAGSLGFSYSKWTIGIALLLIMLVGVWQAWRQRVELAQELRERWKYYLLVEGLFLVFFLVDLIIRLGNPDLWHSSKGGERPMDFTYFNAILRSTTFPPYDPWYAGGYINYYYYGYVIVGTPVKLLGIEPSIAFNFILPTLFACMAVAGFSVGWNILDGIRAARAGTRSNLFDDRFIGGVSAASALVLLGNLGIVRLMYQGFQRVAAPGGLTEDANLLQRLLWSIKGFFMVLLGGLHLPYGPGDWYWFASRIFPAAYSDFYEFPVFTFIWSDLHAHMMALMLTVLVIAWALSVLLAKGRWDTPLNAVIGFFLGGLIIGSLKPTNTWDFYTYFILGAVVLFYSVFRYSNPEKLHLPIPGWGKRLLLAGGATLILAVISTVLYQPFSHWFGQAYTSVQTWKGPRTPLTTYLTQWGVFLFFIVSWMIWETRQWLAATPVSALHKLRPYRDLIIAALVITFLVLVLQQGWVMSSSQNVPWRGISILWLALPLAVWAALLLFRPGISDPKKLVLFMTGTALLLTMMVEIIVVSGDIGRFNTVFKFGLQSWVLFGICAAACFGWLLAEIRIWLPGWRTVWSLTATLLGTGAMLFLIIGGSDKIRDRMTQAAPRTLDSMLYMNYAHYSDYGQDLDLSQDYRAIQWMQDHVQGSPVIVEAASAGVQYQWHARFSIYTGLPDVVGWEWHQVQQRVIDSSAVIARGKEVDGFYGTTDLAVARDFLRKYNARYIIVGQLERAKYAPGAPNGPIPAGVPDGLLKFDQNNGTLWNEVYRDGQTVIYEVPAGGELIP